MWLVSLRNILKRCCTAAVLAGAVFSVALSSAQGLLTRHTDCSGSVTLYRYDRHGQLTETEDAAGHITRREWSDAGDLTTLTYLNKVIIEERQNLRTGKTILNKKSIRTGKC